MAPAVAGGRRAAGRALLLTAVLASLRPCARNASSFVAAPAPRTRAARGVKTPRQFFNFEFGEPAVSANAQKAYDLWAEAYPSAAAQGVYLGDACEKSTILQRFAGMGQLFGEDVALGMVQKEPILLLYSTEGISGSFGYIKGLETAETEGQALTIVQRNPRCLTVPDFEYQRTKPALSGMMTSSAVIDALRPLGPGGLFVAIFGGFIALILVLRPIFYGVGGGPSLISMITGGLPSLPSPKDLAEENGISLPLLVALIPIAQVLQIGAKKVQGKE